MSDWTYLAATTLFNSSGATSEPLAWCEGTDGKLYMIFTPGFDYPVFGAFDPTTHLWSLLTGPGIAQIGAAGAALGSYNGKVIALYNTPGPGTPHTRIYSISGGTWSSGTPCPAAASALAYGSSGQYLYIITDEAGSPKLRRYDMSGDSWSLMSPPPAVIDPATGFGAGHAAVLSGVLYVFNGLSTGGGSTLSGVYAYDIGGNSWTTLSTDTVQALGTAVGPIDGKIFLDGAGSNADFSPPSTYVNGKTPLHSVRTVPFGPASSMSVGNIVYSLFNLGASFEMWAYTPGAATTDISATLLDTNFSFVSYIQRTKSREWYDALNDVGYGHITFQNDDPDLDLVTFQSFINFMYKGQLAYTMLCEDFEKTPISQKEEAEQITIWKGRSHVAVLERALLYPSLPVGNLPVEIDRFFGWPAPIFDDSAWINASEVCTVATAKSSWAGGAAPWDPTYPDDTASVLWASDGTTMSAGVGHCWFRSVFNIGISVPARAYMACDNGGQLFLDGIQLIDTGIFSVGKSFQTDFPLSAGLHLLAVQCENLPGGAINPAGFAASVYGTDVLGNLTGLVYNTNNSGLWKIVEYSDNPPPITIGAVMIQVIDEAIARGVAGFPSLTLTFDDTNDTAGNPWPVNSAISARVGIDLLSFFIELSNTYIDFSMTPGTLELNAWIKGTRGQ